MHDCLAVFTQRSPLAVHKLKKNGNESQAQNVINAKDKKIAFKGGGIGRGSWGRPYPKQNLTHRSKLNRLFQECFKQVELIADK